MFTISNDNPSPFWRRMMATTIANNAVMKCLLSGVPLTDENVIGFVGDFFDPKDPQFEPLSDYILVAIDELVACHPASLKPEPAT